MFVYIFKNIIYCLSKNNFLKIIFFVSLSLQLPLLVFFYLNSLLPIYLLFFIFSCLNNLTYVYYFSLYFISYQSDHSLFQSNLKNWALIAFWMVQKIDCQLWNFINSDFWAYILMDNIRYIIAVSYLLDNIRPGY